MQIFVTDSVVNGIAVSEVSSGFALMNPAFYQQCIVAGGAMAISAQVDLSAMPGVTHHNGSIVVLKELKEFMSEAAFNAVLAHEIAHVLNGDVDISEEEKQRLKKLKVLKDVEMEMKADAYAASIYGAQAMIDAIDQMHRFQVKKILRSDKEWIIKAFTLLNSFGMIGKRVKRLKSML